MKVLVIDDRPVVSSLLKALLVNAGYTVLVAPDGKIGAEKAMTELPEFIVSDMGLASSKRSEIIEHLKANVTTRDIPVIVTNSQADRRDGRETAGDHADTDHGDRAEADRPADNAKVVLQFPGGELVGELH